MNRLVFLVGLVGWAKVDDGVGSSSIPLTSQSCLLFYINELGLTSRFIPWTTQFCRILRQCSLERLDESVERFHMKVAFDFILLPTTVVRENSIYLLPYSLF